MTLHITWSVSQPATAVLHAGLSSRIAQVVYQGQACNTRILECKPLINTSYCIWHRLELKYFHFAQFLLNAHQAAHWPRKVRTKNLKFRTDLPDQVIYGWSVTSRWLFAKKNCSENLQIENQSSICQRWSLHGFKHHISFATYLAASFGCNQFRIPKP